MGDLRLLPTEVLNTGGRVQVGDTLSWDYPRCATTPFGFALERSLEAAEAERLRRENERQCRSNERELAPDLPVDTEPPRRTNKKKQRNAKRRPHRTTKATSGL